MLSAIIALLGPKILAGLAAAATGGVALLVAYLKGRSQAAAKARVENLEATLDLVKEKKDADEAVGGLSDRDARSELQRWSRG